MASAVSETTVYEASVIGPDGGDPRTAASVRDGLQDLANRSKYLKVRADALNSYFGSSGVAGVGECMQNLAGVALAANWDWAQDGTYGPIQKNATVGTVLRVPFVVPAGVTITDVRVYIKPAGAHGGLPAVMPAIQTKYLDITGTLNNVGTSQSDTSGSVGAYEAVHSITKTGLSFVTGAAGHLFVDLTAESGANSLVGCLMLVSRVFYTAL